MSDKGPNETNDVLTERRRGIAERRDRNGPTRSMLRSVVKVMTTSDAPDYEQPWQTEGPDAAVGSGAIVMTPRGARVLTNAHVVQNEVFIEVRRYGKSRKFEAVVEGVGHVCDLALLKVKDPGFTRSAPAIPLGGLPKLGDRVSALGFPIGGERLSITEGVVSRIEVYPYAHSQRHLLAVQIDAAINAGNSGGPVVKDGEIVGVAFEALDEAENVGYMISAPVVKHFLRDLEQGVSDGFPDLGVVVQPLESKAHRKSLGLSPKSYSGVLITGVMHGSSADGVLKEGDVLLTLDNKHVAADGSVSFRKGERIDMTHQVATRHVGDSMSVKVNRKGKELTFKVELKPPRYLVAEDAYDVKPTYYLYGGLLFVPLSRDLLKTWGPEWWQDAPPEIIAIYENEICTSTRSEIVILQKVLADRVNQGYHDVEMLMIERVQGKKIRHLRDLIRIVESAKGEFIRFQSPDGQIIVLERTQVEKSNDGILRRYGVPTDRSENLQMIQSRR